jgi:hypothetical protein
MSAKPSRSLDSFVARDDELLTQPFTNYKLRFTILLWIY